MKYLIVLVLAFGFGTAFAQDVLAEGLNGPQGILVADDGSIWVIDSGLGGNDGEVTAFFPNAGGEVTAAYGQTARIVKIDADGSQTEVATLPSIAVGQEVTGGARLALLDGELYASSSFWVETAGPDAPPLFGSIVKVADGEISEVANLWMLERDQNPGGFIAESHPYGLLAGPDGNLWVADAGANTLLKVNPATGESEVVAVFEGVPGPLPNPAREDAMEADPVPTAVAVGSDGGVYVSYLVGFPFIPGTAKVVKVADDGSVSDYAMGLTSLTDLRLAPDGNLYAIQFAQFGEQGPAPMSGALVRIAEGDSSEIVIEGLIFPTSVDFDAEGNAYITVNGVGVPGSGQVVKYEGIAAP
ncbi:MAG: ScyD/ScyE family protein [Trueperaceae bacterium]|nr:ScyD/ScyE family protein [Trueperaceae bacterium]